MNYTRVGRSDGHFPAPYTLRNICPDGSQCTVELRQWAANCAESSAILLRADQARTAFQFSNDHGMILRFYAARPNSRSAFCPRIPALACADRSSRAWITGTVLPASFPSYRRGGNRCRQPNCDRRSAQSKPRAKPRWCARRNTSGRGTRSAVVWASRLIGRNRPRQNTLR